MMSKTRRTVVLATILLGSLGSGCVDPYRTARVEKIALGRDVVFVLDTGKPLREMDVLRTPGEGGKVVLWRITRSDKVSKAPLKVDYGVVPGGFRQVLPRSGSPEPLKPATYLVRCRDYALGDVGDHYLRLGIGGENTWRAESGRDDGFGEAELRFRVHADGRIQCLGPDFIDEPGP